MVFNGLIGLGTVVGQTAYNILAFNCPCLPKKNYLYGLAAIGVPALAFFVIGVMMNQNTWDVVSECRTRRCRKLSVTAVFALLGSVVGRAVVAPITWTVISLLRGEAYVCAFSEFMNPSSSDNFFLTTPGPEIMAQFPCKDVPAPFMNYSVEVEHKLKYESQVLIIFHSVVTFPNCINTSDKYKLHFLPFSSSCWAGCWWESSPSLSFCSSVWNTAALRLATTRKHTGLSIAPANKLFSNVQLKYMLNTMRLKMSKVSLVLWPWTIRRSRF